MKTTQFLFLFFLIGLRSLNAQTFLTFDGVDDYATVPRNGTGILNDYSTPHDFTVEIRFKYNSVQMGAASVVSMHSMPANGFFMEFISGGRYLKAGMGWNGNYSTLTTPFQLLQNSWYTAALVYNRTSNTFKYFIDGSMIGSEVTLPNAYYPERTYAIALAKSLYWGGATAISVDFFRIWTNQQTQSELNTNKSLEVSCSSSNLLLQYKFDASVGIMNDCSPNNHHGTLYGANVCQVTNNQNRIIRQGNNVVVNGHTYSATGIYRDTIIRSGLCDSIIVTHLTVVNCNLMATITRNNTTLTANPTGGYAPFTYAWSNPATTATLQNVTSGVYGVTITDSLGCTTTASITVSAQRTTTQRYQLQVTDAQCGGAQPATLHLNMNTTRSCMDALMVKIQFDSTKVFFDNNLIIQKGAAIDTSGRVFYSISRDTLLMTVDLSTGCIQGDSGTNVLRLPFRLRPTFALPRATSAFNLTVLEERILSGATRDTTHQSFEVSGTLLGKIQVFRPNANAVTGNVRPVSVFVGDTCSNLNRVIAADSNAQAFARIDSFRYFKLHRPPLSAVASPLIGGYDVFLMRSYVHDGSPFTNRQRIAADVNNDGTVSALDITIVRRRSVGIYTNFADYSAGRLTCDYQFTLQNSDTPKVCFRLPALAADCDTPRIQLHMITLGDINGDTDTVTSTAGIRGNDSNGIAKSNNNLTLQLCRATRVGTEWKIPVFANAVTRGLDLQLLNLPETGILSVESANPAAFEVSANAQGVGNNYYIIGYANHLQGIPANDTLLYLYVKTTNLSPLQLGSLKGYLDAQEVNTQKLVCTPTSDLYTHLFEVYPNPTTSIVQLTTQQPLSEPTTLRIYDMLGRCVKTQVLERGDASFNIDLSNLANSVYQFHFANQYQKVVKQ